MTLLSPILKSAFGTNSAPTTLTPRNDVVYQDLTPHQGELVKLSADYSATYEEIVRTQLWVRTAINKLAYSMGSLPLKTYLRNDDSTQRDTSSPLSALIRRPNDTRMYGTTSQLIARVVMDLYTYGNALLVKVAAAEDAVPAALHPVHPRHFKVLGNGRYVWRDPKSQVERTYEPWQIIHIIEPGPRHAGFGVSRLEAARLTLAIEYAAQQLGAATFMNGARPGGILRVQNLPTNPQERLAVLSRFKDEIVSRFGGAQKAGLPAVLEGDVEWTPMSHNLDDSSVVNHRQLTRTEVAALFDIPQPVIGILDNANFASIDALHLAYYQDTLGWPINLIEDTLNSQLVAGVPEFENQFLEFDLRAVTRGDISTRASAYNQFLTAGVYTPNELRRLENLPPVDMPAADQVHVPLHLSGAAQLQTEASDGD